MVCRGEGRRSERADPSRTQGEALEQPAAWQAAVVARLLGAHDLTRAHGDSTGEFDDAGYGARRDVCAAVEFLERRRPGRPVIVDGNSLGSAAAIFAAGELGHRVAAYILECPYQDLKIAVWNRIDNCAASGPQSYRLWRLEAGQPDLLASPRRDLPREGDRRHSR